jgi:hypothetical protein
MAMPAPSLISLSGWPQPGATSTEQANVGKCREEFRRRCRSKEWPTKVATAMVALDDAAGLCGRGGGLCHTAEYPLCAGFCTPRGTVRTLASFHTT